jgi:phosphatidylserine/phosphatidylglycerophosphate/cardiolipin synthase-like enzyme
MRNRAKNATLSVQVIAGSAVVLLGMNIAEEAVSGLLGFAIHRIDHTEGEEKWLPNFLTFEVLDKGEEYGPNYSSETSPIQEFLWGDYTVKEEHTYTYRVVAMYGEPGALKSGDAVEVEITTESQLDNTHAVYFNRGVAASQAYARRFNNQHPDKVPRREAYKWLSRGLEEALLRFIGRAKGNRWSLRAALYEFDYLRIHEAFRLAAASGADVRIVVDCITNRDNNPRDRNLKAIEEAGIENLIIQRQNSKNIAHNKFIVLLEDDKPAEVWTGSTNITDGGIFGQSNVGHIVRDPQIAAAYFDYWQVLNEDPDINPLRDWTEKNTPVLCGQSTPGVIQPIFSPRRSLEALECYAQLMDQAKQSVFLTAAFGVTRQLREMFEKEKPYLRYLLLEKENAKIETINRNPSNRVAAGAYLGKDGWAQWLDEKLTGFNQHVRFVHTKYMLIDPLSDNPIVITGSANFSEASTNQNDENMMVIRGDTRVADIYLTEFMRLFTHFRFRGKVQEHDETVHKSAEPLPKKLYLRDSDRWARRFYVKDSPREKERLFFS